MPASAGLAMIRLLIVVKKLRVLPCVSVVIGLIFVVCVCVSALGLTIVFVILVVLLTLLAL